MTSIISLQPDSIMKSRHSARGHRKQDDYKQIRIERSKSAAPVTFFKTETDDDASSVTPITAVAAYDPKKNDNVADSITHIRRESVGMFLTSARRKSTAKIQVPEEDFRSSTPLSVDDLTEEELDAYFFDDPDPEPDKCKFDVKLFYLSKCEKENLLPSSTFLRQLHQPTCNLSNLMMNDNDIRPIAVSLVNNPNITELNLSENDIGNKGILHISEALRENVFITRVTFSRVGLDPVGMKHLQEGLKCNKTVSHLDLSANHLDANSAVYLAKMIQENDFITELILRENDLDDKAGTTLSNSVASNLTLRYLDLSWNHLRGHGASNIVKAICENVELIEVNLSWNGIGEEGAIAFGKYFPKNHTLRKLDITNTRINFINLGHILTGLKLNDTLETLKITGNPFSTDGAIAILKCLQISSSSALNHLHLEDTPISYEFLEAYKELQQKKDIHVYHKAPNKKKIGTVFKEKKIENYDPLLLLFEFMKQENFRLIDLFKTFDQNQDNVLSKQELKDGFMRFKLELSEEKLDSLMSKLDLDESHTVDFHELIYGKRQAVHVRHMAEKDKTGRLIDDMNHLKTLVEKARKDKFQKDRTAGKNGLKREPSVFSFEFPPELRKALEQSEEIK